jgi:chromosome segregation ATPase
MKKLKFYIPVLAIACAGIVFSTTSCVDDSESQSVTNLRGAKADQLKAEAALATAQAEAAKIAATAEAALKNAQAEAAKAQAKLTEAEAAYKAAQTEADKEKWAAEIELAKEAARQAKAQADVAVKAAEYQLAQMKIQAELDLLNLQNELEKAKNDDPVLKDAIEKYSIFITQVNEKKMQIAKKNLDLTKRKALLADKTASEEEMAATQIKYKNEDIASFTEAIEANKIEIANWNVLLAKGGADIEAEIAELKKQKDDLIYNKSVDVRKALDVAIDASDAAKEKVQDFRNLGTVKAYLYYDYDNQIEMVEYYTVGELKNRLTNRKTNLASMEKSLQEWETKYNKAEQEIEGLYNTYLAAQKATGDALAAANKADADRDAVYADAESTPAQKEAADAAATAAWTAYGTASTAEGAAYTKYTNAQNDLNIYQSQIVSYKGYIADYKSDIADLETAIAAYNNDSNAPRTLETAYYTAFTAMGEAQSAYSDLNAEIYALQSEMDKLNNIYYSNGSATPDYIKGQIKMLEDTNIANTNSIAQLKRDINELTATKTYNIEMLKLDITELEAEIAKLTVELGVAQKQADAAKAIVDARTK